jgi:hypothetical protein
MGTLISVHSFVTEFLPYAIMVPDLEIWPSSRNRRHIVPACRVILSQAQLPTLSSVNDDIICFPGLPSQPRQFPNSNSQALIPPLQRPDLSLLLLHCPFHVGQSLHRGARFLDLQLNGDCGSGEIFGREQVVGLGGG